VSRYYVGTGSIRAEVTDGLRDELRALVDKIAPGIRDVLERESAAVLAAAEARWPVASGESKAGLYGGVQVAPDLSSIRGFLANNVGYSVYVKSFKGGLGGRSAVVELLRKPITARTRQVTAEIGAAFERIANAGR
jgi:hypothetical protein